MFLKTKFFALLVFSLLAQVCNAQAATACVFNKKTGRYETKDSALPFKRSAVECQIEDHEYILGTLQPSSEAAINAKGTKVIDGVIVTNTNAMPEIQKAAEARKAAEAKRKEEALLAAEAAKNAEIERLAAEDAKFLESVRESEAQRIAGSSQAPVAVEVAPVPVPVAAAVVPEKPPLPIWISRNGANLYEVANEWAKRAGYEVDWRIKDEQTQERKDFILGGGMKVTDTFENAVIELFGALPESAKVMAKLVPDNFPPSLIVFREGEYQ